MLAHFQPFQRWRHYLLTHAQALLQTFFLVNASPARPVTATALSRMPYPSRSQPSWTVQQHPNSTNLRNSALSSTPALIYSIQLEPSTTYTRRCDTVPIIVLDSFLGGLGEAHAWQIVKNLSTGYFFISLPVMMTIQHIYCRLRVSIKSYTVLN